MNGIQEVRGSNPLSSTTCFHDLSFPVTYKECGCIRHFFLNKERCLFCREFHAWSPGEKHRSHQGSFIRNGSSVSHGTPISIPSYSIPSYIKRNETFSTLLPCIVVPMSRTQKRGSGGISAFVEKYRMRSIRKRQKLLHCWTTPLEPNGTLTFRMGALLSSHKRGRTWTALPETMLRWTAPHWNMWLLARRSGWFIKGYRYDIFGAFSIYL